MATKLDLLIELDSKGAVSSVKALNSEVDKLTGTTTKADGAGKGLMGSIFGQVTAANLATQAIGKMTAFVGDSVREAIEAEAVENKRNTTLRAYGESVQVVGDSMDRYASQMQGLTGVTDEEVTSLMTLGKNLGINNELLRGATEGAIGLTTIYGGSMQGAIEAISNAYRGNWGMMEKIIPELKTMTDESDKLALMQRKMAEGFDASKSAMEGAGGQLITAKNQWGDFKEAVGGGMLTLFSALKKVSDEMTGQAAIARALRAEHERAVKIFDDLKKTHLTYAEVIADEGQQEAKEKEILEGLAKTRAEIAEITRKDQVEASNKAAEAMEKEREAARLLTAELEAQQQELIAMMPKVGSAADDFEKIAEAEQWAKDKAFELYVQWMQTLGVIPKFEPEIDQVAASTKKWSVNWKDANEVMELTKKVIGGVIGVIGSLGYEFTDADQGVMDFSDSMINLGVAIASGNIAGVIASVAGAVAGLAKALFAHKETHGEFMIRIEEERKAAEALRNSLVNLSDTISNMSAWTDTSFENYTEIMKGLVSEFGDGLAVVNGNVESALASWTEEFGSAFTAIMRKAKLAGQEGSAALIEMFETLASKGIRVAEVQDYINAKLESAADAYADLKDAIDDSKVAQEVFGNISVPILDEILAYRAKVAENGDLVDSIGAATRMMTDFTDATRINQGQFDQFSTSAVKSFEALQAGGMDGSQALQAMAPYLQRLQFLHEQYGYVVDENTQKLLDQAIKEGKVTENKKTDTQQIIDLLGMIATQLGADIPDALGKTSKAATDAFEDAKKAAGKFNDELDDMGTQREFKFSGSKGKEPDIQAAGGFYSPALSRDTLIQAHKGEEAIIVPKGGRGVGGKTVYNTFNIYGAITPENVAPAIKRAYMDNTQGLRSLLEN